MRNNEPADAAASRPDGAVADVAAVQLEAIADDEGRLSEALLNLPGPFVEIEDVPTGTLKQRYDVQKVVGAGGFAKVRVATKRVDGSVILRAVKTLPIGGACANNDVEVEALLLARLQHPNIVTLIEALREPSRFHLVLEYLEGGTLASRVRRYNDDFYFPGHEHESQQGPPLLRGLPAKLVAVYLWQILAGLEYLHQLAVVHRDVKADNYVFQSADERSRLKLVDFGAARCLAKGVLKGKAGTVGYEAPEMCEGGSYSEKIDVWGAGVVSYFMCVGRNPFRNETQERLRRSKVENDFVVAYPEREWNHVPSDLQAIVRQLLTIEPSARPGATEVLRQDPWLRKHGRPRQRKVWSGGFCCSIS